MHPAISKINKNLNSMLVCLDSELSRCSTWVCFERRTGLPKAPSALILCLGIFSLALFAKCAGDFVVNLVGFVCPFIATLRIMESERSSSSSSSGSGGGSSSSGSGSGSGQKEACGMTSKHWLTYWMVYGAFNMLGYFRNNLLAWVPFFAAMKLAVLAWMFMPYTKGAMIVHDAVIMKIVPLITSGGACGSSCATDGGSGSGSGKGKCHKGEAATERLASSVAAAVEKEMRDAKRD